MKTLKLVRPRSQKIQFASYLSERDYDDLSTIRQSLSTEDHAATWGETITALKNFYLENCNDG